MDFPAAMPNYGEPSKLKLFMAQAGLFYAAAIWGATFFLVKGALDDIDPVVMVAYRFIMAGCMLLIFIYTRGLKPLADIKIGLFLGFILWLLYIPQTIGLGFTTASNSGFITGLFVAFVPVFLRFIFKRKPTLLEVIASGVSLIGLWILTGGMKKVNIGDALTLIAAMTYALHLLYSDKYMKGGIDPYITSCQQFLVVGFLSLISAIVFGLDFSVKSQKAIGVVVFLALFPTLSAFVIQMLAQKIVAPLRVALIFALEPVFAALFAWTVGGESFVWFRAVGGGFIFAALLLSAISSQKPKPAIEP